MELELTQKEKEMASSGIVFSTSKPNLLCVLEGLDGGNYVCQANWQIDSFISIVIYDMDSVSDTQLLSLNGIEIKAMKFEYVYNKTSKTRKGNMRYAYILNQNGLNDLEEIDENLYKNICEASETWPSQPADIIAKRLFIEILTFSIHMRKSNLEVTDIEVVEEGLP